jgi:hypothetical protein
MLVFGYFALMLMACDVEVPGLMVGAKRDGYTGDILMVSLFLGMPLADFVRHMRRIIHVAFRYSIPNLLSRNVPQ